MFLTQSSKELQVLRRSVPLPLQLGTFPRDAACVGPSHHVIAQVESLRRKLVEIRPAAHGLRQPGIGVTDLRIGLFSAGRIPFRA